MRWAVGRFVRGNYKSAAGLLFGVNLKDFPLLMFFCARKNVINYAG